jgi:hypothetical protein
MSSITTLTGSDGITTANTMTKVNTNFANLNSDKIETSTLDTDTSLTANSDSKIATQKAVRAYVDSGGNQNASETTRGIVQEATDAQVTAGTATGSTGAKLFVSPAKLATRFGSGLFKFGGTGADGALAITSGATNIDCANAAVVVKNYTSISITGTGSLTFTNPHTNGTVIVLKSQGNITLTSSAAPMIDASGIGASGGVGASYGGQTVKADGGRGGAALSIECGGAWNFTTTAGISVAGKNGIQNVGGGAVGGGGGGGGGVFYGLYNTLTANTGTVIATGGSGAATSGGSGGGAADATAGSAGIAQFIANGGAAGVQNVSGIGGTSIFAGTYNSIYSKGLRLCPGGGGGGGSNSTGQRGGGGGASLVANGSTTGDSTGGAGGAGYSLVALNTEFA